MSTAASASVRFATVVVTSDFSGESEKALSYAKSIVRGSDGQLLLAHVAQLPSMTAAQELSWFDDTTFLKEEQRQTEAMAALLRKQGLRANALCFTGAVGQNIAKAAYAHNADLVVAGTHGRRGLNRLVFGSVAEEIAGALDAPLLVVGPKAPDCSGRIWQPKRVLCVASFLDREVPLVAFSAALASHYRANLEIASGGANVVRSEALKWNSFRSLVLRQLHAENVDALPAEPFVFRPWSASMLVQVAISKNSDLMIVGRTHAEWLALHEGVLQEVLSNAPCPVLTIPTQRR